MTLREKTAARKADDTESSVESAAALHELQRLPAYCTGEPRTGNMLIHGDNLHALDILAVTHPNSVRCAYLDPPYNNGDSYKHYEDSMGHDEWLAAVTARLVKVKTLLSSEGSVWISIDDSELHYLKVAADGVFGRGNFVGTIVWERRTTRENRKILSTNHEYLLVYAKDVGAFGMARNALPLTQDVADRYKNPDGDARGPWQSVTANVQAGHATPQQFYALKAPSGKLHDPPKGRCWVHSKAKMLELIEQNLVWFGRDGNGVPRLKRFLADREEGLIPDTLWRADDVGTTSDAKKHLLQLFKHKTLFDTPKPEALLERIIHISTRPGDVVLDAYLGSGTGAAVAHKTQRRYIGIEIGDHIQTHCVHRLRQVVKGEEGGVSSAVGWRGGGGFDFYKVSSVKRRAK